jgi:hypothetical protein
MYTVYVGRPIQQQVLNKPLSLIIRLCCSNLSSRLSNLKTWKSINKKILLNYFVNAFAARRAVKTLLEDRASAFSISNCRAVYIYYKPLPVCSTVQSGWEMDEGFGKLFDILMQKRPADDTANTCITPAVSSLDSVPTHRIIIELNLNWTWTMNRL